MMTTDFTDRDVFGYAFDKGWMCVQVFFIRQGKLIERDVSMFPLYNEPEEEILTYLGQFYTKANHFKPKEILVPDTVDVDMAEELLNVKVLKPQRGPKKELLSWLIKMLKLLLQKNSHSLNEMKNERLRQLNVLDKK